MNGGGDFGPSGQQGGGKLNQRSRCSRIALFRAFFIGSEVMRVMESLRTKFRWRNCTCRFLLGSSVAQ